MLYCTAGLAGINCEIALSCVPVFPSSHLQVASLLRSAAPRLEFVRSLCTRVVLKSGKAGSQDITRPGRSLLLIWHVKSHNSRVIPSVVGSSYFYIVCARLWSSIIEAPVQRDCQEP